MLKISEFSKLSGASVKTLRYYDRIGIVKPAFIDANTGYRYYSEEQLLTLKRIAAFKQQGFTLEQIRILLEEVSEDAVTQSFVDKKKELAQVIRLAQQQLDGVNERLNQLRILAQDVRSQPVTIRCVAPQLAATIRDVVPRSRLCLLLDEIFHYVRAFETEVGPPMILWHDRAETKERIDVEVALPLKMEIPENSRVVVRILPQIDQAACLLHNCDPYANACAGIKPLLSWIRTNGYVPVESAPFRESYRSTDDHMYGPMRSSEILIPVVQQNPPS